MPWLMVLQALVTLALGLNCWRYARAAAADHASLWQAVAEQRMHHNALESATHETFADIGDVIADLSGERITVAPPPLCSNCRKRRQLAVN